VKKRIFYEQPLNERVRSLLRLEHLFEGITYCLKGASLWDNRAVIDYLLEIIDLISRIDFKTELMKDLDRYAQELTRWQRQANVDTERITQLLDQVKNLQENFRINEIPIGESLSQHYLINLIRQRGAIPGGTCRFDLPAYHFWLQKSPKQRQTELNEWLTPLEPLRSALELDLYLLRNNATVSQETASGGLFQSTLDATTDCQLLRVGLPIDHPCYPEMSGSKHRISVRFFEQGNARERPLQTEQEVSFELYCCRI
jgi:cell division protein ZapD